MEAFVNHGTGWMQMKARAGGQPIGFRTEFLTETCGTGRLHQPPLVNLRRLMRLVPPPKLTLDHALEVLREDECAR